MRIKHIVLPVLIGVLAGSTLAIASRTPSYDWLNPLIDVRDALNRRYVTEPDHERMQRAAIEGMISALGDPHTEFIWPDRLADLDKRLRGTYVGIGAEVNMVDGWLTIVSPMEGSPALEAGLLAGDVVLEIEGESTFNEPIQDLIDRLMGEPGTPVTIKVRHLDGREEELTITRRQIVTRTVRGLVRSGAEWSYCLDESLGLFYLRVMQFTDTTARDLARVLEQLNTRGLNGLVLDLRDNPGGSMMSAVQVSDLFLDGGTIVSVRDRAGDGRAFQAYRNGTLPNFPMVILVNESSASASEIVAGALQENGRAKVLGTRTFGKASVQELRELPHNQGTLKFTTAHYHLPSGRNLNRLGDSTVWGVDPDPGFVMRMKDEDYIAMLRARREFEIIRESNNGPSCAVPSWIRENLHDVQLAAAAEALQERVRGNPWPNPGEETAAAIAFDTEMQRIADERTRLLQRLERLEDRLAQLSDLAQRSGGRSILPEDVDLLSGTVTLRDRHGNVVGTYRIDGGDPELALRSLRLTPVE